MITPPSAELMVLAEAVRVLRVCKSTSSFPAGFCLFLLKSDSIGTGVAGGMLAHGLADGRVMLVDEATGEVKWDVQAHPGTGGGRAYVSLSPDNGRFVASVGMDEEHWKLWNATSGAVHRVGARHDGSGACICRVTRTGRISVKEGCPVVAHTDGLRAVAFSPCEKRLVTGALDGAVIVWEAQTGDAEHRLQVGEGEPCWSVSFSVNPRPSTLTPHPSTLDP